MNLQELATSPVAFDTKVAELLKKHDAAWALVYAAEAEAHREAGDTQTWVGRTRVWGLSLADALISAPVARSKRAELERVTAGIQGELRELDAIYDRAPWSRFFPTNTNSGGHIHSSTSCRTLHSDTVVNWAPYLSGTTEAEAVDHLDEALCSVCFPSAPVALHNYTSKRSQAERYARAAEKAARDAKKAAKQLTEAEVFRTRHGHDTVATVAACKTVIRDAVEAVVELEWLSTPAAEAKWSSLELLAAHRVRAAENLLDQQADAELAEQVLIAREARTPGHGATVDAIAKIKASKDKSARKDWLS